MYTTTILEQKLLKEKCFPCTISLTRTTATHVDNAISKLLTAEPDLKVVGVSYLVGQADKTTSVCIATPTAAVLVKFPKGFQAKKRGAFASLLSGHYVPVNGNSSQPIVSVGFRAAHTVIQVNHVTTIAVTAVDLNDIFKSPYPSAVVSSYLSLDCDRWGVTRLWLGDDKSAPKDVSFQAWLAALIGAKYIDKVRESHKLTSERVDYLERSCLADLVRQVDILESIKPREKINDFSQAAVNEEGCFQVHNSRFMTRVRRSMQTQIVVEDTSGNKFIGKAAKVKGKQTTLKFSQARPTNTVHRITVRGREEATNSELACYKLIFNVLAGVSELPRSMLIKKIWLPHLQGIHLQVSIAHNSALQEVLGETNLNGSQRLAANAMTGESPIVVVHGPPGTGKTTTIAASARVWDLSRQPAWIVAHSNVAVKNIAESLAKKGVDFKLIVSKEFYEEWHEHLYIGVEERLIQSDKLASQKVVIDRVLLDSCIILSTLSMLSNPTLRKRGVFELVPLERLVIDEASQIDIFEFLPIFHEHHDKLQKVCFFGDPFQLPPFGQKEAPTIQTIFDLKHVMKKSKHSKQVFLDTQYRMPTTIGSFISQSVYQNRLNSVHTILTPGCLAFVHTIKTGEEKSGKSTRNTGEVDAIVHLVDYYYKGKDFCIITPYDAQRAAIQDALKRDDLPWERVFNLDSFQGNEAQYVLVSVVRSARPGFLTSLNRMNVMLTRCKKGMVIVSNKGFLGKGGGGHKTLLGKLYNHWKVEHHANTDPWIDWQTISEASVDLPGVPAPNPSGLVRTTASASFSLSDGMDSLSITSRSGVALPSSSSALYRRMLGYQAVPVAQMPVPSPQAVVAPSAAAASTSPNGKRTRTRRTDASSQMLVMQDGADR